MMPTTVGGSGGAPIRYDRWWRQQNFSGGGAQVYSAGAKVV